MLPAAKFLSIPANLLIMKKYRLACKVVFWHDSCCRSCFSAAIKSDGFVGDLWPAIILAYLFQPTFVENTLFMPR
jgi:hypothetical protein